MREFTRILIVSESPILPTGMAEAIRLIFGALLDCHATEYELHQIGLYHSYGVAEPRWPVYPTKGVRGENGLMLAFDNEDLDGRKSFPEVLEAIKPDIVFGFNDPQRVLHLCIEPEKRNYRLVLYVNFDGFPYPPAAGVLLSRADLIVTKSDFSRKVVLSCLPAVDPKKVRFMYSPADITRFVPASDEEKRDLRSRLFPRWMPAQGFVLGWIGRNQWRKQVWLLYQIISLLRMGGYLVCSQCARVSLGDDWHQRVVGASHDISSFVRTGEAICHHCASTWVEKAAPISDVFLWVHMIEEACEDWNRQWLEKQFGLTPGCDIHYSEGHEVGQWLAPGEMPKLYASWDCLLYLSGGEGFGLPPWEAMCCGLPVVYTNYSSHAEFLTDANAGIPVGGMLQPEGQTCIWRMIADVAQAIEAVRKLYFDPELRRRLGANGRSFVQNFTPEAQAENWHGLFQEITRERHRGTRGHGGFGQEMRDLDK